MKAGILILLIAVVIVSLCVSQPAETGDSMSQPVQTEGIMEPVTPEPQETGPEMEAISIEGPMEISAEQCGLRSMEGKMLVIHALGCAECPHVVEKIQEYEQELGTSVEYIDHNEDAQRLSALEISVPSTVYMPAVIIDCKVYTGNMGDRFYRESMEAL